MKRVDVGPHVAAGFPTREFKGFPSTVSAERYLDLLEDCLLLGVGNGEEFTMISPERLRNIRHVINETIWNDVPGDFIETGVWRGGASIYARAVFAAYGQSVRKVYAADSFAGLPPPDPRYPEDLSDTHYLDKSLAVSLEEVKANFAVFDFYNDEQTIFLQGWFDQSLPLLDPKTRFAVIRLDGDMYGSTMDALTNLYDKLSPGGFCIVDDFAAVAGCQKAVNQFRHDRKIEEQMFNIDGTGIFWQKEK